MPRKVSTIATIWRLAYPYFRSEDRARGLVLLFSVIAIELATILINVLINQWNNDFYNAVQDRNWEVFVWQLEYFSMLAGAFVLLKAYQLYLNH